MATQGKTLDTLLKFFLTVFLLMVALEYERDYGITTLQPFFDSSLPFLRHPEVQAWGRDLAAEREHLQNTTS
jgi:hypothetical protein